MCVENLVENVAQMSRTWTFVQFTNWGFWGENKNKIKCKKEMEKKKEKHIEA